MKFTINNEVPGRVRVNLAGRVPADDIAALEQAVKEAAPGVGEVTVYPRIASLAVAYDPTQLERKALLAALEGIDAAAIEKARSSASPAGASQMHSLLMDIANLVGGHYFRRWFLPAPLRTAYAVWNYLSFLRAALKSLGAGKLDVPVLDAAAIGISFVKRDPVTAASTMFLLQLGEILEDYTRTRSENELIYSLLAVPDTAQRIVGTKEETVSAAELQPGDLIAIRTGMPIPIDGTVEEGTIMVNQSALTGEPLAIEREAGDGVFAGTACESGQAMVRVRANAASTKLRSIVSLVEQSQDLKSAALSRRENLANAIVPWNFALAAGVALTTRSLVKTSAALMVDYSCALKLTGTIAELSAMSQSAQEGFTVKGSKHFEAFANADTIIFDKTGTLTDASPKVCNILAFDGWNEKRVLRLAACLEEHFPHPVARAVVQEALEQNLKHRERHAEVEYIVAHGIASSLNEKRVVIGSEHFVVEDEGVKISAAQKKRIEKEAEGLSTLYLAVDGELVGVLTIEDPLKEGVREAIAELHALGFTQILMLTGDNEPAAARAAKAAGVDGFKANLLPEHKHGIVEELKAQGHKVVMVGDGINDSPALSAADVSVAMGSGTAIAREVADITLSEGGIDALVRLRRLSCGLMRRMDTSFHEVMVFNSALLALGITSIITPQTSSLLHNGSTIAMSVRNARSYDVSNRFLPAGEAVIEEEVVETVADVIEDVELSVVE